MSTDKEKAPEKRKEDEIQEPELPRKRRHPLFDKPDPEFNQGGAFFRRE